MSGTAITIIWMVIVYICLITMGWLGIIPAIAIGYLIQGYEK